MRTLPMVARLDRDCSGDGRIDLRGISGLLPTVIHRDPTGDYDIRDVRGMHHR